MPRCRSVSSCYDPGSFESISRSESLPHSLPYRAMGQASLHFRGETDAETLTARNKSAGSLEHIHLAFALLGPLLLLETTMILKALLQPLRPIQSVTSKLGSQLLLQLLPRHRCNRLRLHATVLLHHLAGGRNTSELISKMINLTTSSLLLRMLLLYLLRTFRNLLPVALATLARLPLSILRCLRHELSA